MNTQQDFLREMNIWEALRTRVAAAPLARRVATDRSTYALNPTVEVRCFSWNVLSYLTARHNGRTIRPKRRQQWGLVWKDPSSSKVRWRIAANEDLLALKIVAESISGQRLRRQSGVPLSRYNQLLLTAARQGLLLPPRSKIRRRGVSFRNTPHRSPGYLLSDTFTLQWHITNACDLQCAHCYDRTQRAAVTASQGRTVLRDMRRFCTEYRVHGHICFSGGNPFLHPQFMRFYADAVRQGFSVSILANPVSAGAVDAVRAIEPPAYFQVSLEGLAAHNDAIRGRGHYRRTCDFLRMLRQKGISSAVMLTLTKDNIDQVIPLTKALRRKTDYFTFNRLSLAGEGKNLSLPGARQFRRFLSEYLDASRDNPIMGYKDNLLNILLDRQAEPLFGGCTGFGCGAAFNFLAVLPDGEVHACRKFPSPLGNIYRSGLTALYQSRLAERYRGGSRECRGCRLRPVCGGCLASAYSYGEDIFAAKDPMCFLDSAR